MTRPSRNLRYKENLLQRSSNNSRRMNRDANNRNPPSTSTSSPSSTSTSPPQKNPSTTPQPTDPDPTPKPKLLPQEEEEEFDDFKVLLLLVGPPKYTTPLATLFLSSSSPSSSTTPKLTIKTTPTLTPEEAVQLRSENLAGILYVIDGNEEAALTPIDATLSVLSKRYFMSMDRVDFVIAREKEQNNNVKRTGLSGKDIHDFVLKYERPLTTVVFGRGWEQDRDLVAQLESLLLRFSPEEEEEDNA